MGEYLLRLAGIVCVRFNEDGELSYHVFGDERVRLFIIDERAPHDRVYEWTSRDDPAEFRGLVPEDAEIGHSSDTRHGAIEARVKAAMVGKPYLRPIEGDRP